MLVYSRFLKSTGLGLIDIFVIGVEFSLTLSEPVVWYLSIHNIFVLTSPFLFVIHLSKFCIFAVHLYYIDIILHTLQIFRCKLIKSI